MRFQHERLLHDKKGPVHVWWPSWETVSADVRDMVVFVHGFDLKGEGHPWYIDVAIHSFKTAEALEDAVLTNAVFCAIESKRGSGKPTYWTDLAELVTFLNENGYPVSGKIHAIGHSGAYANIARWLDYENLSHVTLLDATYGQLAKYSAWVAKEDHYLDICVSKGGQTHKNAWEILKNLDAYFTWQKMPIPENADDLQQVLYCPLHRNHMSWVEDPNVVAVFVTRGQHIRDVYTDGATC